MKLSFALGPAEFACPLEAPVDCSIAVNPYEDACRQSRTFGLARAIASNVCAVSSGAAVNVNTLSCCAHASDATSALLMRDLVRRSFDTRVPNEKIGDPISASGI